MNAPRRILLLLFAGFSALSAPAWAGTSQAAGHGRTSPIRVFVVQPKVDLSRCATYDEYRQQMLGLVRAQVTPHLVAGRPSLIVFPEDAGLPAAFVGSRSARARSRTSMLQAYADLFSGDTPPYGMPLFFYSMAFPGLDRDRLPGVALTDTLWRAFYETMREIAVETGAWVISSTNVSGRVEPSMNPLEMLFLADPDLPPGPVYAARDPDVYNTAFVFSPTGKIVAAARKPYITEIEEGLLRFRYGALKDVRPIALPFASIGVVTSKDAWMPDVLDRLAILGAELLIQPEAFDAWALADDPAHPEDWLPDNFLQSGWQAVQKYAELRAGAIPHLTGNLFDRPFDGQSAVVGDAIPYRTDPAYIGQDPMGGFLAVAPWIIPDPVHASRSLTRQERRSLLRKAGLALLPGGSNANGYVETVVRAEVAPRARFNAEPAGRPGVLGASAPVSPSEAGEQSYASVASGGSVAVVAWQDTRDGRPQVYLAVSRDGGRSFPRARRVASSRNPQRTPAVAVTRASIYIAWQEEANGSRRVVVARLDLRTGAVLSCRALPTPAPADEWLPRLATGNGTVFLAFVRTSENVERVLVARTADGAADWKITTADPAPPSYSSPNIRDNQWAPAIAARGAEVAVAWVDFRNYSWDVYLSRSRDGGRTFESPGRVDDAPDARERVHCDPSLAFAADGALVCAWTDQRLRGSPTKARAVRIPNAASSGVRPRSTILARRGGTDALSWRPRLATLADGRVAAVWQDFRTLGNDICLAVSADDGATFGGEARVDDGGEMASYQFAPQVAAVGKRRVLAVWEDTRNGRRSLRYAAGKLPF